MQSRKFVNLNFGATGDGITKITIAIQQTIDRCRVLDGGEVKFPSGNYLTGAVELKSNVMLRLEKESVILSDYSRYVYP